MTVRYVIITNNITNKINEFQKQYGATRTFIANKAGITRQNLNSLEKSENPTIQSLARLAYALDCEIKDLYECKIIEDDN